MRIVKANIYLQKTKLIVSISSLYRSTWSGENHKVKPTGPSRHSHRYRIVWRDFAWPPLCRLAVTSLGTHSSKHKQPKIHTCITFGRHFEFLFRHFPSRSQFPLCFFFSFSLWRTRYWSQCLVASEVTCHIKPFFGSRFTILMILCIYMLW